MLLSEFTGLLCVLNTHLQRIASVHIRHVKTTAENLNKLPDFRINDLYQEFCNILHSINLFTATRISQIKKRNVIN